MKTETEIARENVKIWKEIENVENLASIISHSASCQRFLGFLKDYYSQYKTIGEKLGKVIEKITDLQNAINEYEKGGIKNE